MKILSFKKLFHFLVCDKNLEFIIFIAVKQHDAGVSVNPLECFKRNFLIICSVECSQLFFILFEIVDKIIFGFKSVFFCNGNELIVRKFVQQAVHCFCVEVVEKIVFRFCRLSFIYLQHQSFCQSPSVAFGCRKFGCLSMTQRIGEEQKTHQHPFISFFHCGCFLVVVSAFIKCFFIRMLYVFY